MENNEIEKRDLYIEKITPQDILTNRTKKIALPLSQYECQKYIFNEIKKYIKDPNYYQIISFINFVARQLKILIKILFNSPRIILY